jgi:peptidoglycan glycosyltransferase
MGDTVVSSLSASLQETAYYALGDRKGAVVVMEPSTGRILAMVSKPDFDPNTIADDWDTLVNDENNSSLLNRATNGAYPPGSTFKIVTALDYFRQNGTLDNYTYLCEGSITMDDHTLTCYNGNVHGQENFSTAFAYSCNCAFADMGVTLGGKSLRDTAEDLLFNQKLPLASYKTSVFSADKNSGRPLLMQTSIGQGNTLVSPMHMALITSAIANGGVLMEPTLIDKVVSSTGETVKTTQSNVYKRLMTEKEADVLGGLMESVVDYGTATALSGRGYTVAGKTGSAEFDENGSSHSWFVGYSNVDDPDLVVAIIVENGGTGSEAAVPIAAQIFDTYYFG